MATSTPLAGSGEENMIPSIYSASTTEDSAAGSTTPSLVTETATMSSGDHPMLVSEDEGVGVGSSSVQDVVEAPKIPLADGVAPVMEGVSQVNTEAVTDQSAIQSSPFDQTPPPEVQNIQQPTDSTVE